MGNELPSLRIFALAQNVWRPRGLPEVRKNLCEGRKEAREGK